MKRSVILTDRLGPNILLVFRVKGQVLHRERAHLKVPGCSLVLSALLTKKLPTFLSRLNEISGGKDFPLDELLYLVNRGDWLRNPENLMTLLCEFFEVR